MIWELSWTGWKTKTFFFSIIYKYFTLGTALVLWWGTGFSLLWLLLFGACGVSSSSSWALEHAGFRVGACGVSSHSPWALEHAGFRVGACGVSSHSPWALEHAGFSSCGAWTWLVLGMESSLTRDWTPVACIGRWILTHCATREVWHWFLSCVLQHHWYSPKIK